MPLSPGTKLGQYEIVEAISTGGMEEVYRARDTKLDRDVAIKVIRQELASDPERLKRFEQEARAASALNHPNIITIHNIREHRGTPYIVIEFVEGQTLREILSEGPLPTKRPLQLATQMADGLAKAHAARIVHRDLKPANIMVTTDGFVKILDFGVAKLIPEPAEVSSERTTVSRRTGEGSIVDTVPYMSPEQAAGRPVGYRSNQFAFGSLLYEMATGNVAFKRDTVPHTQVAIIEDEPEPIKKLNDEIPTQLSAIVERCLAKDPEKRYESTAELATELKNVPETSHAWRARRWVLWATAALLATFLVWAFGPNLVRLSKRVLPSTTRAPIESIAVLPLHNLSDDPEQEYFADGLTEALITDLAKIRALKMISRTSAMRYKGTDKPLSEIAQELNVDAVIEGSALRVGDRVRITAQLIDVETDQALWAETYERDFQDLLVLQSEVARAVAREVRVKLTPEEREGLTRRRQVDPKAHEAYLKGRYYWNKRTINAFEQSIEFFDQAIQVDSSYAVANAGLADSYNMLGAFRARPPIEAFSKSKALALKALEIDETIAEAHASLAFAKFKMDWDWRGAEEGFKRSIEFNPGYATHSPVVWAALGRNGPIG